MTCLNYVELYIDICFSNIQPYNLWLLAQVPVQTRNISGIELSKKSPTFTNSSQTSLSVNRPQTQLDNSQVTACLPTTHLQIISLHLSLLWEYMFGRSKCFCRHIPKFIINRESKMKRNRKSDICRCAW